MNDKKIEIYNKIKELFDVWANNYEDYDDYVHDMYIKIISEKNIDEIKCSDLMSFFMQHYYELYLDKNGNDTNISYINDISDLLLSRMLKNRQRDTYIKDKLEEVLLTLTPMENLILSMHYGLAGNTPCSKISDISKKLKENMNMNISDNDIREIECNCLWRIKEYIEK